MSARIFTKWVTCSRPNPAASIRLFCLPFAGGGASAYRLWPAALPSSVEVCPIQLPGREDRYREPALTSLVGLSRALSRELLPFLDRPFAFFGHSMGALAAFETARALRHSAAPAPLAMFLAAYPAPQVPLARAPIHQLPDAEFIEEMRRMQGTPEAVLGNAELMAFVLPILRADFEACDTYVCPSEPPLACPFFMYGGTDDREVDSQGLARWREQTSGAFSQRMFPGTHFFVQSHRAPLLDDIAGRLASLPV
jgi:medium-chain acyl-[acyl-carrier-protein] hydrolase